MNHLVAANQKSLEIGGNYLNNNIQNMIKT